MDHPNEVPAEHQAWFKLCEAMGAETMTRTPLFF